MIPTAQSKLSAWASKRVLAISALAFSSFTALGQNAMNPEQIKQGYLEHAALTQLHRWYQPYENNAVPLKNQLDILTDDVRVKSGLGEVVGHEAYAKRVAEIPKTWKNAHRLMDAQIQHLPDGQLQLIAHITYLNEGAKPDGTLQAGKLKYTTFLKPTDTVLPRFSSLTIEPVSATADKTFEELYPENRIKSLMHYWLALIEDPKRRLEPFAEIFAKDFRLEFSSGTLTDMPSFEKWFRGPGSAVSASTHKVSNFSYQRLSANNYAMQADFDWNGLLPNGAQLTGKTRHNWTVEDLVSERFARIKTVKVQVLQPFAPVIQK
jgi:hypothetical protein